MPANVAIVIAIMILSTTGIALLVMIQSRKRAAKEEELKRAASARGSVAGYIVMAANKDEGARILTQGLEQALTTATHDSSSALASEDRPSILLRPNGISIARTAEFRDLNEIEKFVRAGVALTRSSKFARPFA